MKVTVELDELAELLTTAKLSEYRQAELERVKNENAALQIECERQAKEINGLRCELSTRPREIAEVTKTAIKNANEALRALYRPIVSEEDAANESVPGDRFQTIYKTLRVLVDRLEQEGLA